MTIKSFERPIIELSLSLAFEKARLVNKEYKLLISDLKANDQLNLINQFLKINANLGESIQEYLNDACMDRMYAELQLGGFDA